MLRDWFWPRQPQARYFTETTREILVRLRAQRNDPPYDELLDAAKAHYAEPQQRLDGAERRATAILGGVPVAATVAIAGSTVALDPSKIASREWRIAVAACLIALVLCLAAACYQALLATTKPFYWSTPAAEDAFSHANLTSDEVKLRRAADMFKAYGINDSVADVKVALAGRASRLLSVALALLAVLSLVLGGYVLDHNGSTREQRGPHTIRASAPFAQQVRVILAARNLDVERLARLTSLDRDRLRRALRYGTPPPAVVVRRVTAALDLPPGYFAEARRDAVIKAVQAVPAIRDRVYDDLVRRP